MIRYGGWSVFCIVAVCMVTTSIRAEEESHPKRVLQANRMVVDKKVPLRVDTVGEFFSKGMWYGRLRVNTFSWNWKEENALRQDNWAVGIGGSLMLKSAYFKGFGATIDAYTSQNPFHMDSDDVIYLKAGKDTMSRYEAYYDDDFYMNVIAQLYAEYKISQSSIKYGRQKFESFLTRSNDTKMIPNTFEGLTLVSGDLPKTTVQLAWLTKQKLRDHTDFHNVLTYKSSAGIRWDNNDDSAMHRGLSYQNYQAAGEETDNDLLVAQVENNSIDRLKLMFNYTAVPDVVSSATIEAHYAIPVGTYKIIPGARYMYQFDNGGGSIGGASLTGLLSPFAEISLVNNGGYDNPDSLDGSLVALRIDLKSGAPWSFRLGYSHIGDKADIVAPWRGFPTGGFTRAMGQYNWFSNTRTWMLRGDYDFGKAGWVSGLTAMFRYAIQDYDDDKIVPLTDRNILNLDAIYKIKACPGLQARVRMVFANAKQNCIGVDPSYNEYRFEMNYLF